MVQRKFKINTMKEDLNWMLGNVAIYAVLLAILLILIAANVVKVYLLRSWKQSLNTKTFYLTPSVMFVKNPKYRAVFVSWLIWDLSFQL